MAAIRPVEPVRLRVGSPAPPGRPAETRQGVRCYEAGHTTDPPRITAAPQGRSTARKSSARSSRAAAQREVAHRDRRRESVVERLREPQPAVDGSQPACSIAHWWARSLRAWKSPSRSTCRSGAGTAPRTPPGGTRARATGCPSARRPSGASVSTFGVDTYATPPGPICSRIASSTASGSWTCSIVCRNTTQSTSPSPQLDHVALEADVLARVLQPRVLVGLRVGVDPDHRGGRRPSTAEP